MTTFNNIAKNPYLAWGGGEDTLIDEQFKDVVQQWPEHWLLTTLPQAGYHEGKRPAVLHMDDGFKIAVGYIPYEAELRQAIAVRKGQLYLAKAVFEPDVNFTEGSQPHADVCEWRHTVLAASPVPTVWNSVDAPSQLKVRREHVTVFRALNDGVVTCGFRVRGKYGDHETDFRIFELSFSEIVPNEWNGFVYDIDPVGDAPPTPPPVVSPPATPPVILPPVVIPPAVPAGFPVVTIPLPIGNSFGISASALCRALSMFYLELAREMEPLTSNA